MTNIDNVSKMVDIRRVIAMYEVDIKLTPEDILNKEFKFDAKGYRPKEVDEYLDMIIEDYNEFIRLVKKLDRENHELKEENNNLNNEVRKLKIALDAHDESENAGRFGTNNVDILKRLSNLEKIVYGKNE